MIPRLAPVALVLSALLAACAGSAPPRMTRRADPASVTQPVPSAVRRVAAPPRTQALVTAETENRLLVVDLPTGRIARRLALPADPEDIAAEPGGAAVVVVSSGAGKVTLFAPNSLRPLKVLGGFGSPHIAALSPDGRHAFVTDDARGTLTSIDLRRRRVTSTIQVGAGAHHLSFDLMHQLAWVALGESAPTIVIVNVSDLDHPRVIGRFDPGFAVHDLAFSADGRQVWVTSAGGPDVTVFDGIDQRVLLRVPVGPPPQHVLLHGSYAYLSSGYGSEIEKVEAASGRVLAHAASPYGSFELASGRGYVVTSSLLRGTLAIYNPNLELLRTVHLAPATREVAVTVRAGADR